MTFRVGKTRKSAMLVGFILLFIFPLLISCGGSSSSSTPGSPQPGNPGGGSARFLYVGLAMNQGGLQGLHVDNTSGALAEVPGSPLLFGGPSNNTFSQGGPVAVGNGHVYVGFGPANLQPPAIRSYAIDPSTGSWGSFTETGAGAVNGDMQIRSLVTDPAKHNLYAVYQNNIASFQINSDGSLSLLGTASNLATAFIFSLAISPSSNFALLGVDNCPPKGSSCLGPPNILLLTRDPMSGSLTNTGRLVGNGTVWSPGALQFDPSGKHLAVWTVDNTGVSGITIFSVDASGMLTPAGSPVPLSGGLTPSVLRFDASGGFLYVLESSGASPQPENVTVFSFNQGTGALTQIQSQSLPSGNFPADLIVDDSFVYVFDSQAGTMPSMIYVLKRDANAGTVSAPVFTLSDRPGGLQASLGQAGELRF